MTRISDMAVLSALPASGAFVPIVLTGANYQYDLTKFARAEALFVNAPTLTVPTDSDFVQTTGYAVLDSGAAVYVHDAAVDAAYVAAHPRSSFITANSRGFRLSLEQDITPQMFGAVGGGIDDKAAIQAAYDFAAANKCKLVLSGLDYSVSGAVLFNVDGVHVEGAGWEKTRFLTTAATPAIIVTSKFARIKGIGCVGGSVGTYGIVAKDAGQTTIEGCDARGFVSDGLLIDTQFGGGTTGNNNQFRIIASSFVQNALGVRMEQRADNNGVSFYGVTASGNTSHGMLLKSEGWFIDPNCITEGNGGYGTLIGEDADSSSNTNGYYCAPWTEGNTLGDVHSSQTAGSNRIEFKSLANTYSRHASAVDSVEWIGAGVRYIGSNDGDAAVRVSGNTTAAFVYAASKSGTANVTLHLGGAGTGLVQADTAFSADGNITANQNGSTLGGGRITRGSANGYFESFNPGGTRQGYGFFLNGTALQFDATGTADHFEFLDPVNLQATVLKVSGTQVVGARDTGWTADTGTAKKTVNATYAAGTTLTYSAAYVQAEQTAMATRMAAVEAVVQANSQTLKAIKDALITHGLIGT